MMMMMLLLVVLVVVVVVVKEPFLSSRLFISNFLFISILPLLT